MTIGLLLACYNDIEFFDDCLKPWVELKEELNIKIAISFGIFKQYKELGYIDDGRDASEHIIHKKYEDFLYIQNNYWYQKPEEFIYQTEIELRNYSLNYLLKENCDYIKLIGIDEIYTKDQIRDLVNYIKSNQSVCSFNIRMKNFVFDKNHYILDFCPVRVYKVNYIDWKLKGFHGDDEGYYENDLEEKSDYRRFPNIEIPNVLPKHFTWLDDERSRGKILYQRLRWNGENGCSFTYDKNNKLCFNEEYFKIYNKTKPEVFIINDE